jgi:predicted ATPase
MNNRDGAPGEAGGIVTCIEALHYRSLRYVSQTLGPFHVLVGPNASGKSTFLDVVSFLGDMVRGGVEVAVQGDPRLSIPLRAPDAKHLTWMREGGRFELAVELSIPADRRQRPKNGGVELCRYEVAIDVGGPSRIMAETLWLKQTNVPDRSSQPSLFPDAPTPPESVVHPPRKHTPPGWRKVVARSEEPERVLFKSETSGWNNPFRLASDKAALSSLPEDEERFPVATWFRKMLAEGVRRLVLSSEHMRRPSPPGRTRAYLPDGSNLPHVVHALEREDRERHGEWVRHVREALPDIESVSTREREDDRHRYLVLRYQNGLEAPSWLVSDGTLRVLALTLIAYLPDPSGLYLIEEPENGIHPGAIESVFQSLSSVYGAQVLLATHSPMVASVADLEQILCFARTANSGTAVVSGREHPRLQEWKGTLDPGTLLAAGVLA